MTEKELVLKFEREKPKYSAWASFLQSSIDQTIKTKLSAEENFNNFIKIYFSPRLKNNNSLISKAFYRNKNYSDPYNEITDKVGFRYVVLLVDDINIIKEVIEQNEQWGYSKDRDFEEERINKPHIFNYQSVHYILRNNKLLEYQGVEIPEGMTCEVQIRTLLQHAYSELTHDTIYKPQSSTSHQVLRAVARSMALIETTDKIFGEVNMTLKNANDIITKFFNSLTQLYTVFNKPNIEPKMNYFILDSYREQIKEINFSDIENFIIENKFLGEIVQEKFELSLLYKQPVILFIYYLINKKRNICRMNWPLTETELKPMFIDIGVAFENS